MSYFIIKPIFWNTNGYSKPSGVPAQTGYPAENGFGHEEWNNSPRMNFLNDGVRYRAFHTEGVGNAEPDDGATFVFMIASHDGVQQLVGVAGNATSLIGDRTRRDELARQLSVNKFWAEAWDVDAVQECHSQDQASFMETWDLDVNWIPNWFCPSDLYLWLEDPVTLDPVSITGKQRLVTMYSQHNKVNAKQALIILNHIPENKRDVTWRRLSKLVQTSGAFSETDDIEELKQRNDISKTDREALVNARVGQGVFRRELEKRWNGECAVTGCKVKEINRASHIKPWRASSDDERLDVNNGILLAAHIDALFDRGLISFSSEGEMIISDRLPKSERDRFGLPMRLQNRLHDREKDYLRYHRETNGFEN